MQVDFAIGSVQWNYGEVVKVWKKTLMKPGKSRKGFGTRTSRSRKAGVKFPVGRIHRYLREGKYSDRTSSGASVYLAAVLEYLVAEILELSGNAARENKKRRITPRALVLAIRNDQELSQLTPKVIIPSGGVLPQIHSVLLKKAKRKYKKNRTESTELERMI